jgi:hypothetical protein
MGGIMWTALFSVVFLIAGLLSVSVIASCYSPSED